MQKIRITLTDDLDGTEGAETVRFGLDGDLYEIDLGAVNHARLRQAVSLYIRHAREVTPPVRRSRRTSVYGHFGTRSRPGTPRINARSP